MKYKILPFLLLALSTFSACEPDRQLPTEEQALVGAWKFEVNPSDNGKRNYKYLELDENKKGINGMIVEVKGKYILALPSEISEWKINGDTLIIHYVMTGGIFSVPGKPDQQVGDHTETDYWIIEKKSAEEFSARLYDPGLPTQSSSRFTRVHNYADVVMGRSK